MPKVAYDTDEIVEKIVDKIDAILGDLPAIGAYKEGLTTGLYERSDWDRLFFTFEGIPGEFRVVVEYIKEGN